MSRKYAKIDQYEKQILSMREEGKTHREIAESLGLEKEQIKKWLRRYRIKKEKIEAGIPIRTRGQHRKNSEPKNIIAEQVYEIQRLKMENDLLRDFLRFAERSLQTKSQDPNEENFTVSSGIKRV